MFKKKLIVVGILMLAAVFPAQVMAHTPLCSCYAGGDGTVICEGGFSDGSSAAGVAVRVVDKNGKVLIKGKMDEFSEFVFDKPEGPYKVIFDAGPGHEVKIKGQEIAE
ncbi:MAG TPA: hypothetical protein VKO20_01445 [Desulfosalsimonadaceae bacterium]|nr:hypothetical protein [Desulfosalsimonadaceae bacterium]